MGSPHRPRPFLDSARRRRNQGNGVANPRIIRLTASDVVAAPDAHPSSTRLSQRLGDAAWTLDKRRSISGESGRARASSASRAVHARSSSRREGRPNFTQTRRVSPKRVSPPPHAFERAVIRVGKNLSRSYPGIFSSATTAAWSEGQTPSIGSLPASRALRTCGADSLFSWQPMNT